MGFKNTHFKSIQDLQCFFPTSLRGVLVFPLRIPACARPPSPRYFVAHNFVTHTHNSVTHNSFTHDFVTHKSVAHDSSHPLWHLSHTQLFHTQLFHVQLCHHNLAPFCVASIALPACRFATSKYFLCGKHGTSCGLWWCAWSPVAQGGSGLGRRGTFWHFDRALTALGCSGGVLGWSWLVLVGPGVPRHVVRQTCERK